MPRIVTDHANGRFVMLDVPQHLRSELDMKYGWETPHESAEWHLTVAWQPELVAPFYQYCDEETKRIIYPYALNYHNSFTLGPLSTMWGETSVVTPPQAWIAPEAMTYPFQYGGIQVAQSKRACLIGDDPGAGKTLQSISVFNDQRLYPRVPQAGQTFVKPARDLRVLAACPAFLVENWAEEIAMWFRGDRLPVVVMDKPRVSLPRAGFFVLPYSRAVAYEDMLLSGPRFDGLIADEVHALKGDRGVKRVASFFGVGIQRGGIASHCDRAFLMSGTPIPNNPAEIFNLLHAFAPQTLGRTVTRAAFEGRYFEQGGWGEESVAIRQEALNAVLRASGFMLRRLKADFLPQLPPKRIALVHMPVSHAIEYLVREEAELFELAKMKKTRTAQELIEVVGHIMTVRKRLAILKAPRIIEYILYQLATNEARTRRLVVFMLHTEAIDAVAAGCEAKGVRVLVVDGRVSSRKRHERKKIFQTPCGPPTVFLGQIKAAGVGITLTAARRCGLAEVSWSFADNVQAMDRIHRIGQTEEVEVDVLTFPHAVEGRVIAKAAGKQISAERILDARLSAAILEAEDALAPDLDETIAEEDM